MKENEEKSLTKGTLIVAMCVVMFAVVAGCSVTFYNQWHPVNSTIHTENPMSNSADSADISIEFPNVTE